MLLLNSHGMPNCAFQASRGQGYSSVGSPEIIIGIHYTCTNITGNLFAEFQSRNRDELRLRLRRSRRTVKIFKAGLIGCGFFSQHHLEAWQRMANVQIMAACDYQIERAQTAAPHAYASAEEMLKVEELDFVDIVTRSPAHLEL